MSTNDYPTLFARCASPSGTLAQFLVALFMALGALLIPCDHATAGDAADPAEVAGRRKEIQQQILLLSSEQWSVRTEAMGKLQAYGTEALPQLAMVDLEKSPEVAHRVRGLIREARLATTGELKLMVGDLMKEYAHQNPQDRLVSIRAIVDRASGASVPLLLGLLDSEEDAEVQGEIIRQLGWQAADPDALEPLLRFYNRAPEVLKGSTLWALAATPSDASRETARAALADESPELRDAAIRAIVRLSDHESLPALRKIAANEVQDTDINLQLQALRALVSLTDQESSAIFKNCLVKDGELRLQGLQGIAGLRDQSATPTLIEMFNDDANKDIRPELVETMAAVRDPKFTDLLVRCLTMEPPELRIVAIQALQNMEAKQAAPKVAEKLSDPDQTVRRVAVEAVSFMGYREAIPMIKALLTEQHPQFRWAVIKGLASLGDAEGKKQIIELAEQGDDQLSMDAISLIGEWRMEEGLDILRRRARANNEHAWWALLNFRHDPYAFRALLKFHLKSQVMDPTARYAVWPLSRLYDQRGLYDRAAKLMEDVVKQRPRDSSGLMQLANYAHQAGWYAKSESAYEKIQAIQGTNAGYLNNHAWFYCTAFKPNYLKPEKALKLVQGAVAMEPLSHYYVDTLGWALHSAGRHAEATAQLRRAFELIDPGDRIHQSWQRTRIARSLWSEGKKGDALKEIAKALKDASDCSHVWKEVAGFYSGSGHRDEAVHAINKCVELGELDLATLEMNPEFDFIRKDPGYRYAIERARKGRAAVDQLIQSIEAEVKQETEAGESSVSRFSNRYYQDDDSIVDRY